MYHLLDHCNANNAAELARCEAIGPACAVPLRTRWWVPPNENVWINRRHATWPDHWQGEVNLGRGDKISCGEVVVAETWSTRSAAKNAAYSKRNCNVCRPFDEAWERPSPFYYIGLRPLCCEAVGGHPRIVEGMELTYGQPLKTENFSITRHTPPNHGHGARCLCFFYAPNWDLSLVDPEIQGRRRMTAMVLSSGQRVIVHSASTGLVSPQDCEWCAGTGRIICDDERAGRVSPSHADGGYAEWQRRTMESAVAVRSGARQIGRITNMRSVDGFVVGDIELEDGSVVVERLMRSPFSSISDAEPATTERE